MTTRTNNRISRLTGLVIIMISISNFMLATNYETVANGNWTSTSTWKNGIAPGSNVAASNSITINHSVTLNSNVAISCEMKIAEKGNVSTSTYKFTVNSGILSNYGSFTVKTLENNGGTISNYGTFTISSATANNAKGSIESSKIMSLAKMSNNNGSLVASGQITMSGSSSNNTDCIMKLSGTISIGTSFKNNKGSLSLNGTASIGSGFTLNSGEVEISGTITISGTFTISGAALINYSQMTVTSTFTFNSGKVQNYGTITLNSRAYIYQNASISTSGNVYFKSTLTNYSKSIFVETNDTSTGNFVTIGTVTGEKEVTVKRHINHSGWQYVSSPVSNAKSDVFMGAALYSYNETKGSWTAHQSGESLEIGKGYDVYVKKENKVITFTGKMNTGTITRNITKTTSGGQGYNLVGNPYPAAINWDAATGWTKTNVSNAIYVWDMKTNNISTYVNKAGTNGGSNIIPATQAFFVLCTSTSGGSIKMTDAVKVNDKPNFREAANENIFRVKISNGSRFDETLIRFDENASFNFDNEYDAEKMYSFDVATPQIYSFSKENIDLAISTMNLTSAPVSVKLGFMANAEGKFSLNFGFEKFDPNITVYLEDVVLNKIHDLKTGDYNFESTTGENNDRFIVHFVPVQVVNHENDTVNQTSSLSDEANSAFCSIFANQKSILVKGNEDLGYFEVKVFNMSGQEVVNSAFEGNQLNSIDMSSFSGCFVVKVIMGTQITTSKVVIP